MCTTTKKTNILTGAQYILQLYKLQRVYSQPTTIPTTFRVPPIFDSGKKAKEFCASLRSTFVAELRNALQVSGPLYFTRIDRRRPTSRVHLYSLDSLHFEQGTDYSVNEYPALHGFWYTSPDMQVQLCQSARNSAHINTAYVEHVCRGGDRHTMSSQSVRLGMPALQLELPWSMRRYRGFFQPNMLFVVIWIARVRKCDTPAVDLGISALQTNRGASMRLQSISPRLRWHLHMFAEIWTPTTRWCIKWRWQSRIHTLPSSARQGLRATCIALISV